jgi:hypothetical protein
MIATDASLVSASMKTYQDYAARLMDFGLINTRSALQFAQDIWTARSSSDLTEAMVDYGRRQFECWSEELEEFSAAAGIEEDKDAEVAGLGD